jgi:hypothetical protein
MLSVMIDPVLDALLSQVSADLDLSREETAKVLLESALAMEGSRS